MYFRNAACIILVFDQTSLSSFRNMNTWLSIALSSAAEGTPVVILGTKNDLTPVVPEAAVNEFARERNYFYFSVSSKTNSGVTEAFSKIADLAVEQQTQMDRSQQERIGVEIKAANKSTLPCCN